MCNLRFWAVPASPAVVRALVGQPGEAHQVQRAPLEWLALFLMHADARLGPQALHALVRSFRQDFSPCLEHPSRRMEEEV